MNIRQKLEEEFKAGSTPKNVDGIYKGKLELLIPQGIFENIGSFVSKLYLPWYGKEFYLKENKGENMLPSYISSLLFWKYGLRGKKENNVLRAFPFKTYIAKGLQNSKNVLHLSYDILSNPSRVRKIKDELVESSDKTLLGKAYIVNEKNIRLVAFFRLTKF